MATIHVRLFAGLHQMIGAREIAVIVGDPATVSDLYAAIAKAHPHVEALLRTTVCAIDEEYVPRAQELHDGDRVALIPPVSGGA
jgi:molybdopterin converting factor subunit 1